MKKRVTNLLSVKSLVTLALTAVFALRGAVDSGDFLTVFLMVISFYFGTQSEKPQDRVDGGEGE